MSRSIGGQPAGTDLNVPAYDEKKEEDVHTYVGSPNGPGYDAEKGDGTGAILVNEPGEFHEYEGSLY